MSLRGSMCRYGRAAGLPLLACILVILGLGVGCEGRRKADDSLLTGTPCAPPCWGGIIPGESDEEQVLQALKDSALVRADTIHSRPQEERGKPLTEIEWSGWAKYPSKLFLHNNRVLRIDIYLDQGPTLGQIVERYGPPERVEASLAYPPLYSVVLDYPAHGLTVISHHYPEELPPFSSSRSFQERFLVDDRAGKLEEAFRVTWATYYAPTTLRAALRDVFHFSAEDVEESVAQAYPWHGFGQVPLSQAGR